MKIINRFILWNTAKLSNPTQPDLIIYNPKILFIEVQSHAIEYELTRWIPGNFPERTRNLASAEI